MAEKSEIKSNTAPILTTIENATLLEINNRRAKIQTYKNDGTKGGVMSVPIPKSISDEEIQERFGAIAGKEREFDAVFAWHPYMDGKTNTPKLAKELTLYHAADVDKGSQLTFFVRPDKNGKSFVHESQNDGKTNWVVNGTLAEPKRADGKYCNIRTTVFMNEKPEIGPNGSRLVVNGGSISPREETYNGASHVTIKVNDETGKMSVSMADSEAKKDAADKVGVEEHAGQDAPAGTDEAKKQDTPAAKKEGGNMTEEEVFALLKKGTRDAGYPLLDFSKADHILGFASSKPCKLGYGTYGPRRYQRLDDGTYGPKPTPGFLMRLLLALICIFTGTKREFDVLARQAVRKPGFEFSMTPKQVERMDTTKTVSMQMPDYNLAPDAQAGEPRELEVRGGYDLSDTGRFITNQIFIDGKKLAYEEFRKMILARVEPRYHAMVDDALPAIADFLTASANRQDFAAHVDRSMTSLDAVYSELKQYIKDEEQKKAPASEPAPEEAAKSEVSEDIAAVSEIPIIEQEEPEIKEPETVADYANILGVDPESPRFKNSWEYCVAENNDAFFELPVEKRLEWLADDMGMPDKAAAAVKKAKAEEYPAPEMAQEEPAASPSHAQAPQP